MHYVINEGIVFNAQINRRCALRQTSTKPQNLAVCTFSKKAPARSVRLNSPLGKSALYVQFLNPIRTELKKRIWVDSILDVINC